MKGDTDYRPMPPFCSPDIRRYRTQAKNPPRLIHTVLLHASRDAGGITLQHVATQMQKVRTFFCREMKNLSLLMTDGLNAVLSY